MRKVTSTLIGSLVLILAVASLATAQIKPEVDKVDLLLEKLTRLEQRINQIEAQLNASTAATAPEAALASTEIAAQLEALDQQIRISERRRELAVEVETARLAAAPVVGSDAAGFFLRSADNTYQFRLTGLFQADGRFFTGPNQVDTNTFVLRRIRPTFQGTVARYIDWRVTPDFGDGRVVVQDAYLDFRYWPKASFRFGKAKAPFGLERLQSASDLTFIERALPTSLAPNRDEGVQLYGDLVGGGISYALAAMNGTPDGGSVENDTNDGKDAVARLFFLPFVKKAATHPLRNFGFGIAGSNGKQEGLLPSFRTTAQSTYFSYVTGAAASGTRIRYSPQAYYYYGPLGVLAEYVNSAQDVRRGTTLKYVRNQAWQVATSYFLTGEAKAFRSTAPRRAFDPESGSSGALEIAARFAELSIDPEAFTLGLADLTRSARRAQEWTVGANWYFNRNSKLVLDYEQTSFVGGAADRDRSTEKAVLTRFQVAF